MRKLFLVVTAVAAVLALAGTAVFHFGHGLSWLDSVYFVVTTMSTVGYGDISLGKAAPPLKVFGMFLMVAGPAAMAATFGLITDLLLRTRLRDMLGQRRRKAMRDHIVLCGLGNVGIRTLRPTSTDIPRAPTCSEAARAPATPPLAPPRYAAISRRSAASIGAIRSAPGPRRYRSPAVA